MIDREARRGLGRLLKQVASGRITTCDYQELVEPLMKSDDHSVAQLARATDIIFDSLWDDVRYTGKRALKKEGRREIARWILFLHSECESKKKDPAWSCLFFLIFMALGFLTCGILWLFLLVVQPLIESVRKWTRWKDVWPFKDFEDYQVALKMTILGPGLSNR